MRSASLLCIMLAAQMAQAQPWEPVDDGSEDEEVLERSKNRVNLRIGTASTDDNGRPTICLEVRAVSRLSIEGCGTGTGFLHSEAGGELAHFRAKWAIYRRTVQRGALQTQLGLGLAELQLDADEPGFVLDPDENGIEAIGPEASIAVQWLRPMGKGWELVLNTSAGLAWIPGAGDLVEPQDSLQPFVGFDVGVGF